MAKRWTKKELTFLEEHAERGPEKLARRFKTETETVRAKLVELGLTEAEPPPPEADAALEDYVEALSFLHGMKWKQAAKLFEKVIATAETPQLIDRARQSVDVCADRLETKGSDGDDAGDPFLQAVFEKNQGNLDTALELCLASGEPDKEERFAYLAASIQALAGAEEEAITHLETAIRLEPKNRVHAFHDPDFKKLRGKGAFASLIANEPS